MILRYDRIAMELPPPSDPDPAGAQHFIAGGQGGLPQDSNGRPWTGDNVFSSGDLVDDLTHNFSSRPGRGTTS